MDNETELATLADRMRDLAERLMRIPVMYGVDQGDVDQLIEAAAEIERLEKLAVKVRWEEVLLEPCMRSAGMTGRKVIARVGSEIVGYAIEMGGPTSCWHVVSRFSLDEDYFLSEQFARAAVAEAAVEALTKGAE